MFKRILSVILAVALLPLIIAYAYENEYDASIFGTNAEYLLQESFGAVFTAKVNGVSSARPSGWDIDYRGGVMWYKNRNLNFSDTSLSEKISLRHELLPIKSGEFTLETAVSFDNIDTEFTILLGGNDGEIINLNFANGKIYSVGDGGNKTLKSSFSAGEKVHVKAQISMDAKEAEIHINDVSFSLNIPNEYNEVRYVSFCTGKAKECYGHLYFVNVYKNYIVNEKFLTAAQGKIPYDFTISAADSGSGICYAPGSAYADDRNGFSLKNTSLVKNVSISKDFENTNTKTTVSWAMLMPALQNGVYTKLMKDGAQQLQIFIYNGSLYLGSKLIKSDYIENLWYNFRLDIDTENDTVNVFLNYKKIADNIAYTGGIINNITFAKTSTSIGEVIIDDIEITKTYEKYNDYPSAPVVSQSDDVNTGMVMYPMWREGMHFGWDTVSPYADERKPLLGYYTEGQREVSDWQNKWLSEHGIDYALYPFVRPSSESGEPIKKPVRSEDLNDGYMYSEYSDKLKFAIFISAVSQYNYYGADEFIANVIPYLSQYYFQDPRYMTIANKLPILCYSFTNMVSVFGGASEMKKIIAGLRQEAQRLGFDDIIFCADAASTPGHTAVDSVSEPIRIWSYGSQTGNAEYLKEKTDEELEISDLYIPSIPMGYDDTPWRTSNSSLMEPLEVSSICSHVKENSTFNSQNEKMVLFTCWNEYGEGHYYAPSTKARFGYLNVIRNEFTSDGIKETEELPSADAIARMGVLYPGGRGALKTLADRKFTAEDIENRELLFKYDFSEKSLNGWSLVNCTANVVNGCAEAVATANDPQMYSNSLGVDIDITKVSAMKIRAYTKGVHDIKVYYITENNPSYGQGKYFYSDRISGTDEYSDIILYPYNGTTAATGNITGLRIDPPDDLYQKGQNFGIGWFEFYGDVKSPKLKIEDTEINFTAAAAEKDGTIFIPVYSVLYNDLNAYTVWDEPTKTLIAQKNGTQVSITAGSNIVKINDNTRKWTNLPFYNKGNIFVPYKEFFNSMGYYAEYNMETNIINCSKQPLQLFSIAAVTDVFKTNIVSSLQSENIGDFGFYKINQNMNTETIDGKEAIKIVPITAGEDGLFSVIYINYNGVRQKLNTVIKEGKKMKVSFYYRGVCQDILVENREGGNNTGYKPQITDVSETDWHEFSYIFDNSGIVVNDGDSRWLTLRVRSTAAQSPYLYISDLKIETPEEVETFNYDEEINFKITTPVNQLESEIYKCFVSEYDLNGRLVNTMKLAEGDISQGGDYTKYYTYKPQDGNTVKIFIWDDMMPLCNTKSIIKN